MTQIVELSTIRKNKYGMFVPSLILFRIIPYMGQLIWVSIIRENQKGRGEVDVGHSAEPPGS